MRREQLLIIILFTASLVTRLAYLDQYPQGFHKDEAVVYNAYSLLKTGKDEYGKPLPLIFEALGDYRLPVSIYIAVPFVFIFGLNDFWMRFPAAFFGSITPILLYFLAEKLFGSKKIAILAAFSLTFSPWHILFSRSGSLVEPVILNVTTILAVYWLLLLLTTWQLRKLMLATIAFILSLFIYRSAFLFVPLLLISLLVIFRDNIARLTTRERLFSALALILFIIIASVLFTSASGGARIKHVGNAAFHSLQLVLDEQIREDKGQNPLITRIFHNKLANFIITALGNYVAHFDLSYLFFTGDKNSSINSTPFMGHLYFIELPFFLIGLSILIRESLRKSKSLILLIWLAISPIPASFAMDTPSAVRNFNASIALAMIMGVGLYGFIKVANKRSSLRLVLITFISILYLENALFFFHQFIVHKTVHQPWYRDVGVKEMIERVKRLENKYKKIVFDDYPSLYIFLLYYGKVDPAFIHRQQEKFTFKDRQREIVSLINPKYIVISSNEGCPVRGQLNVLYVCTKDRVPRRAKILKVVRLGDDQPAFTLLEFRQKYDPDKLPPLPDKLHYMDAEASIEGKLIPSSSEVYW